MVKIKRSGGVATVAILAGSILFGASARAQEIPEDHLQAARGAISALGVTNQFDVILPRLADGLKSQLIQAYPNFQTQIADTVDKSALSLAARRGDLEREAAKVYATTFSAEELKGIADFYNSATGKKLLKDGPLVTRELLKAADIWAAGIRRDLESQTNEELLKVVGKLEPVQVPLPTDAAPAAAAAAPAPAPKP